MDRPVLLTAAGVRRISIALMSMVFAAAIPLFAQAPEPSLGEAARAARKAKNSSNSAAKIYTDDNMPKSSVPNVAEQNELAPLPADAPPIADTKTKSKVLEEQWRARIAEQKRRVGDLEYELSRLENENRLLRTEYEDPMTGKEKPNPLICNPYFGVYCVPLYTPHQERYDRYQDYAKQRDALKAQLEAAQIKLDQLEEEFRTSKMTVIR